MNYLKNNQIPNDKIFVASSFDIYNYHQEVMDVIKERYRLVDHSSNGDVGLYVKKVGETDVKVAKRGSNTSEPLIKRH
jgi:hypothetical protein